MHPARPAHLCCDQASDVLRQVAVQEVRLPQGLDAVVQLRGALRRRAQDHRHLCAKREHQRARIRFRENARIVLARACRLVT